MAGRRHQRSATPPNPAKLVRALRTCRDALIDAQRHVVIGGPVYRASEAITTAIDALAFLLTGERDYFHEPGGGATDGQRAALTAKEARERGELPWS